MKASWVGLLGIGLGAASALLARSGWEAWAKGSDCCSVQPVAATTYTCPVHFEGEQLVVGDRSELDRLRRAMRDGIFQPWIELGRAPTPAEIGERLHLDVAHVDDLLGRLETCAQTAHVGIRRVPETDIIGVAWPLANVPTGISLTVDGYRPVHARCAIDALGVSKMVGRRVTVDAETPDGAKVRVIVEGDRLVSAEPPGALVFKGASCDHILFFSSHAGMKAWKKEHGIEDGTTFSLEEAVKLGAEIFGKLTEGLES